MSYGIAQFYLPPDSILCVILGHVVPTSYRLANFVTTANAMSDNTVNKPNKDVGKFPGDDVDWSTADMLDDDD